MSSSSNEGLDGLPAINSKDSKSNDNLKPCCACPETRKARDDCVIKHDDHEVACRDFIKAHEDCLRRHGFVL